MQCMPRQYASELLDRARALIVSALP